MGVSATCQVLATRYCGVRVPRVWRFDSIERQRSALRGLGWSSPAFFKKHAPGIPTLTCHLRLVVAAGADPGIWVVSAWSFHTIHFWPTGYASSSVPRISTAHSPQLRITLERPHRKHPFKLQCNPSCALRIVELTLIRSELSSLDMPKPGMTYTFRG